MHVRPAGPPFVRPEGPTVNSHDRQVVVHNAQKEEVEQDETFPFRQS